MFVLKSAAFGNGGTIPDKYAEENVVSPPLSWDGVPDGTQSFALVVTDPDLPAAFNFPRNFFHWVVYDLPAATRALPEGASPNGDLPAGAKELISDYVTFQMPGYGKGYGGPWPPDAAHRYVFTLYALKTAALDVPADADFGAFSAAVLPQMILSTALVGTYGPARKPLPGS
ncbi:MAG: YbhB/YbcL family Raf kinase inhibitor-like protein [Deferrisomatales bacterium]|nr:YbhB/YbcL family Raf kinase inhibitor-like protein [Deferrisomatales bacterium]